MGYVNKGKAGTELLAAIEAVLQGKHFVSNHMWESDQTRGRI
jgi:DNA-binding NarL/FixJ family response regulator